MSYIHIVYLTTSEMRTSHYSDHAITIISVTMFTSGFLCVNLFIIDGWLLLGSSALTGNIWDGRLSIFSGYDDFVQCPNLTMVASNTPSGVNDALWYVRKGIYPRDVCI